MEIAKVKWLLMYLAYAATAVLFFVVFIMLHSYPEWTILASLFILFSVMGMYRLVIDEDVTHIMDWLRIGIMLMLGVIAWLAESFIPTIGFGIITVYLILLRWKESRK